MSAFFAIIAPILAQEIEAESSGSLVGFLFPILMIGGIFYVVVLMPNRRKQKRTNQLLASVEVGDEIRTVGGIIGKIVASDDSTFTIELEGSRMRITKRAIAARIEDETG